MKLSLTNPFKVLSQHKFTLPQIIVIVVVVGGLAFTGGLMWRNYQKRLANEKAAKSAQAEADRLAKLAAEKEVSETKEDTPTEKPAEPTPKPAPKPAPVQSFFTLKGSKTSKGVTLAWELDNLSVTKGFKLLKSKSGPPTLGSDTTEAVYIKDSATRNYSWAITNGKTYYFRVCIYNGTGCSSYSNTVTVTAPYVAPAVPTGSLTLTATGGGSTAVYWTLNGTAPYGYKLVWAPDPDVPSYPGGGSATFYEKGAVAGNIGSTPGTYNVRVCAYYEGSCKFYSNQVQVILP